MAASRAGSRGTMNIEELDRQMAVVQRAAGIKARSEEMQGHVKVGVCLFLSCFLS